MATYFSHQSLPEISIQDFLVKIFIDFPSKINIKKDVKQTTHSNCPVTLLSPDCFADKTLFPGMKRTEKSREHAGKVINFRMLNISYCF